MGGEVVIIEVHRGSPIEDEDSLARGVEVEGLHELSVPVGLGQRPDQRTSGVHSLPQVGG